jgi:acetylornithine deacetylase/succinyl-diaminopimelate desuccinylase-like protein
VKFAAGLIALALLAQDKKQPKPEKSARDSITAAELAGHLQKLCSAFQGRKSATEGEKSTAQYVAAEFKKYGLKPAGADNSFLQSFPAKNRYVDGTGTNCLGLLEGSDPKLKNEIVAVGAHHDAVGGVGADDNGSGTATVLELAQAFAQILKTRPKRSILFCTWGCEEAWMVGSYYWADHPTLDASRVKFNVNIDMMGRNDRAEKEVTISGAESSNPPLNDLLLKHSKDAGLKVILEDAMISPPGDCMPFYEKIGVPFVYFYTHGYGKIHADYHKPTDSPEKIDARSMQNIGRFAYALLLDLANADALGSRVDGYRFPHPAQGKPRR